jgi:hypothetical protein
MDRYLDTNGFYGSTNYRGKNRKSSEGDGCCWEFHIDVKLIEGNAGIACDFKRKKLATAGGNWIYS